MTAGGELEMATRHELEPVAEVGGRVGTKLNQSRAVSLTMAWVLVLVASVLGACEDNPRDLDTFGTPTDSGVDAGKDAAVDASTKDAASPDSAVDAASDDAGDDDAGNDDAGH
jgi:hypothetical protein